MRGLLENEFLIKLTHWAVVVAQLAERSLLTLEIRSSNSDIGNKFSRSVNCYPEKTKIKKKRPGIYCTEVISTLIKVTTEVDYHYVVLTVIMLYSKHKGHK